MSFDDVVIKGGLGNQLFCLFYANKLLFQKKNVSLNLVNYSLLKKNKRKFVLDKLLPNISNIFNMKNGYKSYFIFLYSKILENLFIKSEEDRLPGDKSFLKLYWPNCYLHSGYFQKITNSMLDQNSLNLTINQISPFLNDYKSQFLAIHIRRGDYLTKKHIMHGIISQSYLVEETKKQISKIDFEGIRIFSDSPELIDLNNFKNLHKNIIIDEGGDSVDVFKRMSNHKGLIASNSSFSLWAGILGEIKYFSIPYFWMKNVKSSIIGLDYIPRYKCMIK
tara:strand:+ start:2800 stop:3633 length:834 start_codon:yes stop_codon:yes gene_type:complete